MRHRLRSGEQGDQEHLEFLDGRIFDYFLLNLHMGFQGSEEAGAPQVGT